MEKGVRLQVSCSYPAYDRIQRLWEELSPQILSTEYGEQVVTELLLKEEKVELFWQKMMDASAGTVKIVRLEELYCPFQL